MEKEIDEQFYPCPRWIGAMLIDLDYEIGRLYWNKHQKKWDSPLQNTGAEYKNEVFELKAYNWNEEDYNFRFGDFKIYWYKHINRAMEMNKKITPEEFVSIYNKCLDSVYKEFGEN